jgi:site-specific DNA-methyltransferase (adenine-specific)
MIPGNKQRDHLAVFPIEIPDRLIKMFSFVEEVVLDPFLGSGTTTLSAMNQNRNSIGIDINDKFLPVIKKKIGFYDHEFLHEVSIGFNREELSTIELKKRIQTLPYRFIDPIPLVRNKTSEIKKYGSRIAVQDKDLVKYYLVTEVLEGDLIRLNNSKTLRLLGVKIIQKFNNKAIRFLDEKTKSRQVFLAFDQEREDQDGNWIGYLYLKNKTFLNAHLIKAGMAKADLTSDYKHKKRFLSYQQKREGFSAKGNK